MGASVAADEISIMLSREQALVLFEWLSRTGVSDEPAAFADQAEQRVLWDLESALASLLTEPLREDYRELLAAARAQLRDAP
jgi:DNA primase